MEDFEPDWNQEHILKVNNQTVSTSNTDDLKPNVLRNDIEPWLSAVFQSDHLSLLAGAGLTSAVSAVAKVKAQDMSRLLINDPLGLTIKEKADETAILMNRGEANIEDDIRITLEVINGLKLVNDPRSGDLERELDNRLTDFISAILYTEQEVREKQDSRDDDAVRALNLLKSFLLSFASRTASRERLHIFTTNYDRFIELACDEVGILLLDRFKGKILPIFRNTRLELDYHYNPPGIRGEPRYVEGVCRITKLHGSIDWRFRSDRIVRALLPFGADATHPEIPKNVTEHVVIYPNSSKDIETSFYPYAELFRDFSSAICQPNSVLVTYGYGFGDSHINRVIEDMLTVPSTHLVIIAWDKSYTENGVTKFGAGRDRIANFLENKNAAQLSLMVGSHFGDLTNLIDKYLPKAAIDRLTTKMHKIKAQRGEAAQKAEVENAATDPLENEFPF